MRLTSSILACAGLAAAASNSFQDTSPFIFFSTSEVLATPSQITTSSSLTSLLSSPLPQCLTDVYFLAHQPGVSASDFSQSSTSCSECLYPRWLSDKSSDKSIRSSFTISQVLGLLLPSEIEETLATQCGASATSLDASTGMIIASSDDANVTKPRVVHIELPALPSTNGPARQKAEQENERLLTNIIEAHGGKSFTVLYTTSPRSIVPTTDTDSEPDYEYEMDNSQQPLNVELKRDLHARAGKGKGNATDADKLPLFEKYQYFTPGLFQGLLVFVLLAGILYVAINAVASLQVSYAAFDKESGPAGTKKQQ